MINKDRIVPVTKTDLLTLYATVLNICGGFSLKYIDADNAEGDFTLQNNESQVLFCTEPVRKFILPEKYTAIRVMFIPAYSFEGIEGVDPNGASLYQGTVADGEWTVVDAGAEKPYKP